jgi:hypothetical protein
MGSRAGKAAPPSLGSGTITPQDTLVVGREARRNTSHQTNMNIPQMADALACDLW